MRKIANQTFANQTLAKQWIKSELLRMGFSPTLQQSDKELLFQIIQGHPDKEKIENVNDFLIQFDNSHPVLYVMKTSTWETISWVACSTGRAPTAHGLRVAHLRKLVAPQIIEYRKSAEQKCELCESTTQLEVDHVYMFKNMIKDYTGNSDEEWIEFHKQKAILRMLCRTCNQQYK